MSTKPNGFETPKMNWQVADVPTPTDFNRIESNSQAIEEGSRTVDQTQSPSGLTGSLRQFLDWIPNRIKTILGTTNWYDSPPVTLTVAKNHIDNKSNPHNVTASQVGAATPAQLAAKVDKPSSATSGNIAVFDGGAGKIKDGGKTIRQVSAPYYATGMATLSFSAVTQEWSAAQYVSTGCSCVDVFIAGEHAGFTFQLTPGNKAMSIIKTGNDEANFSYEYISSPKYTNDILLASSTYISVAGQLLSDGRLRIVARQTLSGETTVNLTVLWRGWN